MNNPTDRRTLAKLFDRWLAPVMLAVATLWRLRQETEHGRRSCPHCCAAHDLAEHARLLLAPVTRSLDRANAAMKRRRVDPQVMWADLRAVQRTLDFEAEEDPTRKAA